MQSEVSDSDSTLMIVTKISEEIPKTKCDVIVSTSSLALSGGHMIVMYIAKNIDTDIDIKIERMLAQVFGKRILRQPSA